MKTNFFMEFRVFELNKIIEVLKKYTKQNSKILEIGAGTGWQSSELARIGYDVVAIDIPSSNHAHARVFDITNFDGRKIPFADNSFDVIYSSNVLEHVDDPDFLNIEIKRVLKDDGVAVHYVPTATWRFFSLCLYYPSLLKFTIMRFVRLFTTSEAQSGGISTQVGSSSSRLSFRKIAYRLTPHAHGARGSAVNELVVFKKNSWDNLFNRYGWNTKHYDRNGLFITGEMFLGSLLSIRLRRRLSLYFGSSAHLYVLNKRQ